MELMKIFDLWPLIFIVGWFLFWRLGGKNYDRFQRWLPVIFFVGYFLLFIISTDKSSLHDYAVIAIRFSPAVGLFYLSHLLLKKGAGFFQTFLENPFVWYLIGWIYLLGFLFLKNSSLFSIYWFCAGLPFIFQFNTDILYEKLRWKLLTLAILFLLLWFFIELKMEIAQYACGFFGLRIIRNERFKH